MIKIVKDKNKFTTLFNTKTGEYVRGVNVKYDPFMADFPHLIDIGIMGHCEHGLSGLCQKAGISCYQNGLHTKKPNMTLSDYQMIMDECEGKVFEVALGGRGDSDCHEYFEEILAYTREQGIVPNFTTSGFLMTEEKARICKKYCGAVAVSMYSRLLEENGKWKESQTYTQKAIDTLLEADVKTNIHFVLSNHTIDEARIRLEQNLFPKGVNAVIFLLHKPTGLGKEDEVLNVTDPKVRAFFELVDKNTFDFKIGFDSCSIAGIINLCETIDKQSIDTCEGSRYSMYIDAQMMAVPCSFDGVNQRFAVQLSSAVSIQKVWESVEFEKFRTRLRVGCKGCFKNELCMGGCPLEPSVVLCNEPMRGDVCV